MYNGCHRNNPHLGDGGRDEHLLTSGPENEQNQSVLQRLTCRPITLVKYVLIGYHRVLARNVFTIINLIHFHSDHSLRVRTMGTTVDVISQNIFRIMLHKLINCVLVDTNWGIGEA